MRRNLLRHGSRFTDPRFVMDCKQLICQTRSSSLVSFHKKLWKNLTLRPFRLLYGDLPQIQIQASSMFRAIENMSESLNTSRGMGKL